MTLADRYRDLARALERIEGLDIEVLDASLDESAHEPVADLRIAVPERAMTETPAGSMYPAEPADPPEGDDEDESQEPDIIQPATDAEEDFRERVEEVGYLEALAEDMCAGNSDDRVVAPDVDEEIVDAVTDQNDDEDDAADVEHGPAKLVCEVDGCDYETESEKGLKIHETKVHTDQDEKLWCGRCGAGPFESTSALSGHHNGAGHDGDLQSVEEPPADQEDTDDHEIGDELDEPSTDETSADGGAVAVADRLPQGETVRDVHDTLDEFSPKPYLGEVADELGIDRDRARTVVYELDRYGEVVDAANYDGEERGLA